MKIIVTRNAQQLGQAAATLGSRLIRQAVARNGQATIVVATGASQFELYKALVQADVPWNRVTVFHLDEYGGMPVTHPASFRLYLWQRFVSQLPLPLAGFHPINGETDPQTECRRLGRLIRQAVIDVALVGIGENGHLAFNDPPVCDFHDPLSVKVVELDEKCRWQQVHDGAFAGFEEVPRRALSLTVPRIMSAGKIFAVVPGARKKAAVEAALHGPVATACPASILRTHPNACLFLDRESAR